MRPIKLKIKGLNSFIDEQVVDFTQLTERGFFGIFGPTGSGKSTILDGITLALYGDLPRKSINYININCNSLNVSFEFSISDGKTKVYKVERLFKTDKKTGRPKSNKCKIVDMTGNTPIILGEGAKEVTKECERIIGLGLSDFTKTVVLPQGSFSEFLKIGGREKREILERLFNLQEYGESLEKKLNYKSKIMEKELDIIKGQLSSYDAISEDNLKIKEQEFKNNEELIDKKDLELLDIKKSYEEGKEVFNLKNELEIYVNEKNIVVMQEKDIECKRVKIDNIEKSLRILNFIENYNKVLKDLSEANKDLDRYSIEFKDIKSKKDNILKVYNELLQQKQDTIPKLRIGVERLEGEIKSRNVLMCLEREISMLTDVIKILQGDKNKKINEIDEIQSEVENVNLNIKQLEEEYDDLRVDRNLRRKIEEAIKVEESYIGLNKDIHECSNDIEVLKEEVNLYKEQKIKLETKENKNFKNLKECEDLLEGLEKNCPGKDEDLLNKKIFLGNIEEKKRKFNAYKEKIDLNNNDILKINKDLNKLNEEKGNINNTINLLEKEIDGLEIESLALKVREKLEDGDICPVCGSTNHNKANVKGLDLTLLKEKNISILRNRDILLEKEREIIKLQEKLKTKNNEIKTFEDEIQSLEENFKENEIYNLQKEIENLENNIKKYKEEKLNLENKLNDVKDKQRNLQGDIKVLDVNLDNSKKNLDEKVKKRKEQLEKFDSLKSDIKEKRNSLNIDNFKEKYDELIKKENEREKLEISIRDKRNFKEIKEKEKNIKNREKEALVNDLASKESALKEKQKQKDNIKNNLQEEFKDLKNIENLEKTLVDVSEKIKTIDNNFSRYSKEKESIEEDFNIINDKLNKEDLNVKALKDKEKLSKKELEISLKEEGFNDIKKVEEILKEKHTLNRLKSDVESYDEKVKVLKIKIESVLKKINNRDISKEEFENIKNTREEKTDELDCLKNRNLILKEEIKVLSNRIEKFREIINKKNKIQHDADMLSDLKKLFSGKKFVDYVATERLKYVALEASKRLMEITSGAYSLEVDKDGKFIIRDFKNGGSIREVSTLSGGETFLTSLALALALSASLQLKSVAPLELFFLDEGFGTLDDDLLEIVISSLERIHNERLKIGIISHVEAIKNRVPVKLIVSKAEPGMGGSKVKLERN